MEAPEFSSILDIKLKNLNACVDKIDSKLDAHLNWHFGEIENARKAAEAALAAAQELASATLASAQHIEEARRWDMRKIVLAVFLAALSSGVLSAIARFF